MVVADRQPHGDIPVEAAEGLADALTERLRGLEAAARLRGADADALRRAVVDGDEDADLGFVDGHGRRHIGPQVTRGMAWMGCDGPPASATADPPARAAGGVRTGSCQHPSPLPHGPAGGPSVGPLQKPAPAL